MPEGHDPGLSRGAAYSYVSGVVLGHPSRLLDVATEYVTREKPCL